MVGIQGLRSLLRRTQSASEVESDQDGDVTVGKSASTDDVPATDQSADTTNNQEGSPDHAAATTESANTAGSTPRDPGRSALLAGTSTLIAVGCLAGWFGYAAYHAHLETTTDEQFVQVARQGALNLANISSASVQQDVQRIVDSSTGSFLSDFQQRAPTFTEFVTKAQSRSEATVREAGLESRTATEGRVLVALSVKVTAVGVPENDPPRSWRMRVTVQKVDKDNMKLSNVEFVP